MNGWLLYAFFASLVSMLAWFYCHGRKLPKTWAKTALLVSLGFYLLFFLSGGGGLWILLRDLAVFAVAAFLAFYFAESAKLFTAAMLILAVLVKVIYFGLGLPWGGFFTDRVENVAEQSEPAGEADDPRESSDTASETPADSEDVADGDAQTPVPVDAAGELLVDLKPGIAESGILEMLGDGFTIRRAFPDLQHPEFSDLEEYYVLDVGDARDDDLQAVVQALYATGAVDWVEHNEIVQLDPPRAESPAGETRRDGSATGPNDPLRNQQWALDALRADELFDELSSQGIQARKRARIAILDTGVDANHPDLRGNYVSTDPVYDDDPQGHGTHCAGIAAAVTNNRVGIASIAPDTSYVSVTSIKVLGKIGGGTQQTIIKGMIQAADLGVDVISMSLGGPSNDTRQRAYNEAVKYANRAGAIVVVAAGNNGHDARRHVPAASKGVIAVAAIGQDLRRAPFSNSVEHLEMGVAAPGVGILSTLPGDKYGANSGTSMATPYVAGLLGLMRALEPDMDTRRAYQLLAESGVETQAKSATGPLIQPPAVLRKMRR